MARIESVKCIKILDSRGNWTIKTRVVLDDGSYGVQSIPGGASTGEGEAVSISADIAVEKVNNVIGPAIVGHDADKQSDLDSDLRQLDGTENKSNLGANSILSVSLATASAAAMSQGVELYQHLRYLYDGTHVTSDQLSFPTPVFNILNGGKHAQNGLSFQEFMIIPAQRIPYDQALEIGRAVYFTLRDNLKRDGYSVGVGDEGGFSPSGLTTEKALDYIKNSASQKYTVGHDLFLGMDVAAGSFYDSGYYDIPEENLHFDTSGMVDYCSNILNKYEVIYFEDGLYERDYNGWKMLFSRFKDKLMIVGDDLVVTNNGLLQDAIDNSWANAFIVKPNQIGSLTETFDFIRTAKEHSMSTIVSHRSGETAEDTFIADLSLAVGADFIKAGAPVRGERVVKYNRLLEVYYSK